MIVGVKAGPASVGPTRQAPISWTAAGTNDRSNSLVNTPGLT